MKIKNKIITELSYLKSPAKRRLISLSKKLKNKHGLEIGGPSSIFKVQGIFPIYVYANKIDGVNFSTNTIWEGSIVEGETFTYFENKTAYQFIAEATNLISIENNCYDFVLSSHSLEHTANPLKALSEWNRVLKNNGLIILVLPDKNSTFDSKRPYTTFEHLLNDFNNEQNEYDKTHFSEILELHDFSKDSVNKNETLKEQLEKNFIKRSVHHHVFSFDLIRKILEFSGFEISFTQLHKPFHMVTVAKKIKQHC